MLYNLCSLSLRCYYRLHEQALKQSAFPQSPDTSGPVGNTVKSNWVPIHKAL